MFIGVARILSGGALFSYQKINDFLVVALKERLNTPPNLTRPAKTTLKIDSCSGWGGVHLHISPVIYAWKIFFHRPGGGAGAPTAPPGYAYVRRRAGLRKWRGAPYARCDRIAVGTIPIEERMMIDR